MIRGTTCREAVGGSPALGGGAPPSLPLWKGRLVGKNHQSGGSLGMCPTRTPSAPRSSVDSQSVSWAPTLPGVDCSAGRQLEGVLCLEVRHHHLCSCDSVEGQTDGKNHQTREKIALDTPPPALCLHPGAQQYHNNLCQGKTSHPRLLR